MRARARFTGLVLVGMAAACGDNLTEVVPERAPAPPDVAFATSSTDDGLSITTDKDDYAPGDTVWFTGAGWPAYDTLDILLEDEPATHPPHTWTVAVGETGTFRDSTYVVDVGDLGVTFTLTATSRATGRILTVTFTDGNLQLQPNPSPDPFSPNADGVKETALITYRNQGAGTENNIEITIRQGTAIGGALVRSFGTFSLAQNTSGTVTWDGRNTGGTVVAEGQYGIRVFNPSQPQNTASGQRLYIALVDVMPPVITLPAVSPLSVTLGLSTPVTLTGTATDNAMAGVPVTRYAAVAAEYNIDGGAYTAMTLSNGSAANIKNLGATIPGATVQALATGPHLLCIRATDNAGNTSPSNVLPGNTNCATLEVNTISTETHVVSSLNPSRVGQSVTFTASVTHGSPAAAVTTGGVTFKDGTCASGVALHAPVVLNGSGQAAIATNTLPAGSHTISACYGGAGAFSASENSLAQEVNNAATQVELTSSANPSVTGQSVSFTAKVTSSSGAVTAGQVTFRKGGGTCDAGVEVQPATNLNPSGEVTYSAAFAASQSPVTIRACYGGAPLFDPSETALIQKVNPAETSTSVVTAGTPTVFSAPMTFTATVVTDAPGSGTPAGSVAFKNGSCAAGSSLGSDGLDGTGKATVTVPQLPVGTHTISACYPGNADFSGSGGTVAHTVVRAKTSTGVSSSANPSVFSQTVTFSVTVTANAPATATPAGSVTLVNGTCMAGTTLGGPSALSASGQASFTTAALGVGLHTITACYGGSGSFEGSDGGVTQDVQKASTTTVVSSSVNPSILAQPVTFAVTVSSVAPAVATPAGDVTLKSGSCATGATIGDPTALNASGQASFTVSTLAVGQHTVTACYAGNPSFNDSDGWSSQQVKYNFEGLFAPVDRPTTMNVSKAGQAIPLKWRLTDFYGAPVLDFSAAALGVAVSGMSCPAATNLDQIEEYAGNSGLQNLGDGYYQFNWKTPQNYALTCRAIGLNLGEGSVRGALAYFNFKK